MIVGVGAENIQLIDLFKAIRDGVEEFAAMCLALHPEFTAQKMIELNNKTPLIAAVCGPQPCCSPQLFSLLLNQYCDINAQSTNGCTVVHYLAQFNRYELLKKLIQEKKTEILLDIKNNIGERPLHYAVYKNSMEALYLLIEAGCNVNTPNDKLQSPLHIACNKGNEQTIRMLLDAGAKIDALDSENRTPAHYLASAAIDNIIKEQLLALLKEYGATLTQRSAKGNLPWEIASNYEFTQFSQYMKENTVPTLFEQCIATICPQFNQSCLTLSEILPEEVIERLNKTSKCLGK